MDGVRAAASVIAVIDLSNKVVSLCYKYAKAVKDARFDIERLQTQLEQLIIVLEDAQKLLKDRNRGRLETSQRLGEALSKCGTQLEDVRKKLEGKTPIRKKDKMKAWFSSDALKWPFESKDVDHTVQNLTEVRNALSAALQIDQT